MNDVNNVLKISRNLEKLNNRLAELDAERRSIQSEIALCMSELGLAASGHVMPDDQMKSRQLVIWVLHKYPERPMSPRDIAYEANLWGSTIRSLLQRMVKDGVIRRVTHGRYELVKR